MQDTTAPVISSPGNQTLVPAACDFVVVFSVATATDNCDPNVTVVTTPSSSSILGIGVHTITTTATDRSGNSSSTSFTVTVLQPLQVIFEQPPLRDDNVRDDIETDADESVDAETALARVSRPETSAVIEPEAAYVPNASELPQSEFVGTQGLRFRGDQIVATVNGAAIFGKDLAPLPRDEWSTELSMSREMYALRLQLGIERELTFQLAKSEGLLLSDSHIRQLERLRTSRAYDEAVIDPIGDPTANIEFEVRQAEARLFEGMLLENDGVPGPHVTEEAVEQYYVEHGADFDPLPEDRVDLAAAWQVISFDIRQILSTDVLAEYQEQRTRFYEDRLADADVAIYLTTEPL